METINRRKVLMAGAAATILPACSSDSSSDGKFKISLAEYSLHRRLFGRAGYQKLDHLDFPKVARSLGIDAVEYVNIFFPNLNYTDRYLRDMKERADDEGVKSLLIMCGREGNLGEPDKKARSKAVDNHKKWVEAAAYLGCHSIRVDAKSKGTPDQQIGYLTDGLNSLCEFGDKYNINIIIENHGGISSDGEWVAKLIQKAGHKRLGTLPDFGNFYDHKLKKLYDPYIGTKAMLPFAKAVSAKSYDLVKGKSYEMVHPRLKYTIDFKKLVQITIESGYTGYVGIEYEGENAYKSEERGILMTKSLLRKLQYQLS